MARRRRNQSVLEDLTEPFEHLPWWAGLTVAVVLVALGIVLPHSPTSGLFATVMMAFLPWILWIPAGLVALYTVVGVAHRALDRRRLDRTEDGVKWSQVKSCLPDQASPISTGQQKKALVPEALTDIVGRPAETFPSLRTKADRLIPSNGRPLLLIGLHVN
jgi:hypothetical protein